MSRRKDAGRQAVRQAEIDLKNARTRARKLLRNAKLDLHLYRKQLKTLQKQEIVSKRITTHKHIPTRYMLSKLKKFKGVAVGHELAVPAKKLTARQQHLYTERGLAERIGKYFVIPKTAERQIADIHKDHIRVTTQLNRGEEQVIKIPARMEDLNNFLQWADDHQEQLNSLKGPRDQFGFQLFGHNAKRGFENMRALLEYLGKYSHILNSHKASKAAVQEFVLIRFRPAMRGPVQPTIDPYYGSKSYTKKRKPGQRQQMLAQQYRREKERTRKARYRILESKEEHAARIERQREYDRQHSNDRREKRMGRKLMGD